MPSSACDWSSDVCSSDRSEEHTSELQSRSDLVCRLLLEKKKSTCTRRKARQRHHCTHPAHFTPSYHPLPHVVPNLHLPTECQEAQKSGSSGATTPFRLAV